MPKEDQGKRESTEEKKNNRRENPSHRNCKEERKVPNNMRWSL
jgi:hypothetical protein